MKKTLLSILLTVTVVAFGTAPLTAAAAEAQTGAPADRLEAAKTCYIDNMIVNFKVGLRISGGELSAEQTEAIRTLGIRWMNEDLIPFLKSNGLLEEWVAMQFDKDIREIYRQTAAARSVDDLRRLTGAMKMLTKRRYPDSFDMYTSREFEIVMQKFRDLLVPMLTE